MRFLFVWVTAVLGVFTTILLARAYGENGGQTSVLPQSIQANPSTLGKVPRFTPAFWQGQGIKANNPSGDYLNVGTVLTGRLAEPLSSKTSKAGDTFTIVLEDGYAVENRQLIPAGSRIIGSVIATTPAKSLGHGMPGNLQVSLQSIVFPNGHLAPIYAFIERNPNQNLANQTNQSSTANRQGLSLPAYGQSFSNSFTSIGTGLVRRIGLPSLTTGRLVNRQSVATGLDFSLNSGDLVPVRLTQALVLDFLKANKIVDITRSEIRNESAPASVPGLVGNDPDPPIAPNLRLPAKEEPF